MSSEGTPRPEQITPPNTTFVLAPMPQGEPIDVPFEGGEGSVTLSPQDFGFEESVCVHQVLEFPQTDMEVKSDVPPQALALVSMPGGKQRSAGIVGLVHNQDGTYTPQKGMDVVPGKVVTYGHWEDKPQMPGTIDSRGLFDSPVTDALSGVPVWVTCTEDGFSILNSRSNGDVLYAVAAEASDVDPEADIPTNPRGITIGAVALDAQSASEGEGSNGEVEVPTGQEIVPVVEATTTQGESEEDPQLATAADEAETGVMDETATAEASSPEGERPDTLTNDAAGEGEAGTDTEFYEQFSTRVTRALSNDTDLIRALEGVPVDLVGAEVRRRLLMFVDTWRKLQAYEAEGRAWTEHIKPVLGRLTGALDEDMAILRGATQQMSELLTTAGAVVNAVEYGGYQNLPLFKEQGWGFASGRRNENPMAGSLIKFTELLQEIEDVRPSITAAWMHFNQGDALTDQEIGQLVQDVASKSGLSFQEISEDLNERLDALEQGPRVAWRYTEESLSDVSGRVRSMAWELASGDFNRDYLLAQQHLDGYLSMMNRGGGVWHNLADLRGVVHELGKVNEVYVHAIQVIAIAKQQLDELTKQRAAAEGTGQDKPGAADYEHITSVLGKTAPLPDRGAGGGAADPDSFGEIARQL